MQDEFRPKDRVALDIKNLITRACLAVEALEHTNGAQVQNQTRRISSALEQVATLCTTEFDTPITAKSLQTLTSADIKQLLREVVQSSRKGREPSANRIAYRILVAPDLSLTVDKVALSRILFSLTSNAVTAMVKGGGHALSILVRNDADGANEIVFDVIDSGPGLPNRILAFLHPHADRQPLRRGRLGTGLMSAVSRASELGGAVTLMRSDASGTAFRVCVPTRAPNGPMPRTRDRVRPPTARYPYTLVASPM